jgi:hypothetical protein
VFQVIDGGIMFDVTVLNGDLILDQIRLILGIGFVIALMMLPLSVRFVFRVIRALVHSLVRI